MKIEPGCSTAFPFNVEYRIGRIASYLRGGDWLDYGCADGGYSASLLNAGATSVTGVDVAPDRIVTARESYPGIPFYAAAEHVFPDDSFDGVFMNEVFEHVADEDETLRDVCRMLRPGGHLIIISPNRGFPFECHTLHIGTWSSTRPTPFIPWLPKSLTEKWVSARNYWPAKLRRRIEVNGFTIVESGFIMPVFEGIPWLPPGMSEQFRRHISSIERFPGIRRLGVSNLVVARLGGA
jgi:ubiquinone/menaquinone biosynthesis C-methylase UbiE